MSINMVSYQNLFAQHGNIMAGRNQKAISQSLNQLSSGLRINAFKDDPSRMAISEKMRGFILGLQTSSRNAQDGISYLQTAEGATTEITNMLQRMRELAVEGANGIYTYNDRLEIQREIDQLKEEINRISESTQFNTKKLINGDSIGAWNSGSEKISAVLNRSVADGNYDIFVDVKPGLNQVQSSQILTLKEGKLGATIVTAGSTNLKRVSEPKDIEPTSAVSGLYNVTLKNPETDVETNDTIEFINSYQTDNSNIAFEATTAIETLSGSGYLQIEFLEGSDTATTSEVKYRAKFISAETGEEGAWLEYNTTNDGRLEANYSSNGYTLSFDIPMVVGGDIVKAGDKFLWTVSDSKNIADGADLLASGGATLRIEKNGVQGPFINYIIPNSLTKADNKDGIIEYNDVQVHIAVLDSETGVLNRGSIVLGFEENSQAGGLNGQTLAGVSTIEVRQGGQVATETTKLSEIANFVDGNGVEIFAQTQELKIYGNNSYTSIYLESDDTVESMVDKITKALVKELNMGSGATEVDKKLVMYNNFPTETGFGNVPGIMTVQSALTGKEGEVYFIGDQKLMDAFGFDVVQEAVQNVQKVTVKNNHTGEIVGERITSNSRLTDIIPGLDIVLDTRTGVDAAWNIGSQKITFSPSDRLENKFLNLHIVDARTELQVGVEYGEQLDVSIPSINTLALGISNTNINTQDAAQRAITEIDNAITKVTSVRATIGALVNRLQASVNNLATSEENATAAESRIRDTDIAKQTTALTTAQVGYDANIALLVQANQIPQKALQLLQ